MKQTGEGTPVKVELCDMLQVGEYAVIHRDKYGINFVLSLGSVRITEIRKTLEILSEYLPPDHPMADIAARLKAM